MRLKSTFITALFVLSWMIAVSFGVAALLNYSNKPGRIGAVPKTWPADSQLRLSTSGQTLVMLAHPRCPCTSASTSELAKIIGHVRGKVRAYVVFLKPKSSGAEWEDTDLRRDVAEIPGVSIVTDVNGVEANRFGAETSGHTLLFDSGGRLLFSGGITDSRGHTGDNAGESAIVALINNQSPAAGSTSVFGCALVDHARKSAKMTCPR
jgi:hypothetical protein